jgi:hypothetical protein
MQYGPADAFPRAAELPGGPASDDAILVTCAYIVETSSPWVLQSLFLAAIAEARDRGAKAVETFAFRYPEGESAYERFHVHKTIFPADFLGDFGFQIVRSAGRAGLARLDLGGLVPAAETVREKALRLAKQALVPEPLRDWLWLNPFAQLSERMREALLLGGGLQAADGALALAGLAVLLVGALFFERLAPHFEDFL